MTRHCTRQSFTNSESKLIDLTTREQSVIQKISLQSLGQKKISHKLLRRYDVQHRVLKFGVKISLFL